MRGKEVGSKFCNGADLKFQTQYHWQSECYIPWSKGHHRTANNKNICWEFWFNERFWPKLASPLNLHPSKPQEVDKLSYGEALAFLAILLHSIGANCKMFVAACKQWRENFACPNPGLKGLFFWFQLTVKLEIRAWGSMLGKEKDVLRQIQELFCLGEFILSSDPRSGQQGCSNRESRAE